MGRHTVIFDGECGICSRSVAWLKEADREGRLEYFPFQDPTVLDRFPGLTREECEEAMQLISPDGTRRAGARAVEAIIRLLPGWRALSPLFRVPGVRVLAHWIYRTVAVNRSRLGCGDHCAVRRPPSAN